MNHAFYKPISGLIRVAREYPKVHIGMCRSMCTFIVIVSSPTKKLRYNEGRQE